MTPSVKHVKARRERIQVKRIPIGVRKIDNGQVDNGGERTTRQSDGNKNSEKFRCTYVRTSLVMEGTAKWSRTMAGKWRKQWETDIHVAKLKRKGNE